MPHEKPEVVHAFLLKRFAEYIATHPEAVHEVSPPDRQIPERSRVPRVARNASEWIQFRTEDAEWLLWTKTCKQCHTLNSTEGQLPIVAQLQSHDPLAAACAIRSSRSWHDDLHFVPYQYREESRNI